MRCCCITVPLHDTVLAPSKEVAAMLCHRGSEILKYYSSISVDALHTMQGNHSLLPNIVCWINTVMAS